MTLLLIGMHKNLISLFCSLNELEVKTAAKSTSNNSSGL